MAPIRGWGIKGERLKGFAPDGRWRTLTFLAALRANALTAPCVIDGPINGVVFRAYVEQFLVPEPRGATSSSSTTSAAIVPGRYAARSSPPAQSSRSCRLLARLQSDRAGLRQGEALAAHGSGALHRRHP